MAKAKRSRKSAGDDKEPIEISSEEKVARLLGLLLVKGLASQTDQAAQLRRAGFEILEIADMLGMTPNGVSVAVYQAKKAGNKKKSKSG